MRGTALVRLGGLRTGDRYPDEVRLFVDLSGFVYMNAKTYIAMNKAQREEALMEHVRATWTSHMIDNWNVITMKFAQHEAD